MSFQSSDTIDRNVNVEKMKTEKENMMDRAKCKNEGQFSSRKLLTICSYNILAKAGTELALFSVDKVCTLHLTSFLLSVPLQMIAMSQSTCGILTVIVKNTIIGTLRYWTRRP